MEDLNTQKKILIGGAGGTGSTFLVRVLRHFGFDEDLLRQMMQEAGWANLTRLTKPEDMITFHYRQEPIILMKASK